MDNDNQQLHYLTLESRARPARVAILMNSSDVEWHHTALRIIELLSSIWGGKHSIIVPTDGSTIDPTFWAILERFSPDYVYSYTKTGADIKLSHPEEYAARLQQQIGKLDSGFPVFEMEKERIDSDLQAWADRFGLDTNLCSQIADRLVPFHFQKHFHPASTGYVPNELTSILDVLPYVDRPQAFLSLDVPPEISSVWWAAQTGMYPKALSSQLGSMGIDEQTVRVSAENLHAFADWIAGGAINPASPGLLPLLPAPTPFHISMSGTGLYGSPLASRDFGDHFALVLGDSLGDFCLSYCLPRIGHRAAWLPAAWTDALETEKDSLPKSCILPVLYAAPHGVRRGIGVNVCSLSSGDEKVLRTLEVLKKYTAYESNGERLNPVEPTRVVTEQIETLIPYCIDSPNHSEIYPFLGNKSVGAIRSPRPNGFSKLSATKHRWVTEVITRSRAVPTIPHIAENLVMLPHSSTSHDVRISQKALAYVCPSPFLVACRGESVTAVATPKGQKQVYAWRVPAFGPTFSLNPILTISLRQATSNR